MRFKPNPDMQAEMMADVQTQRALLEVAERVAEEANRNAHQIMPRRGSGSRNTVAAKIENGQVMVVNTDHAAHIDEYGSVNNPAYAPMRRAIADSGLKFEEQAKSGS